MRHSYTERLKTKQWDITSRNGNKTEQYYVLDKAEFNAKSIRQRNPILKKDEIHEQVMNCDMPNNFKICSQN